MASSDMEKLVVRLEAVTNRLEAVSSGGGGPRGDDDPIWFDDFQKFHNDFFVTFYNASKALGGELAAQADLVNIVFNHHKSFLQVVARHNVPAPPAQQALQKPLSDAIIQVQEFREKNRASKQFFHLSAVSECIPFLGWVAISPKPALYVKQMEESTQFYTNKIMKEFRESDIKQADWAKSLIILLKKFADFVKDNHATGLQWNREKPAATLAALGGAASAPAPPPPGPPPPPPPVQASSGAPSGDGDGRSQLFAQLNQGSNVTSGLKKVTDDMKTHKNPELRAKSTVPAAPTSSLNPRPYTTPTFKKFSAPTAKKPPVFELQNKKWVIENQDQNEGLVISNANEKQTVYMYKCNRSILLVKEKINSIILDSCEKCAVVFDDIISTFEFTNCKGCKVQINGVAPTISIEKTDGAQVYLTEKCLDAHIITAKSSEMNICITKEDGDLTEFPIPEQYKSVWNGKRFQTTTMDLNL